MELKETIKGYFERTQLPPEIAPEKAVPACAKKINPKAEAKPAPEMIPQQPAPAPQEEKPAPETVPQQPAPAQQEKPAPEIGASAFIKMVRHHHITGKEFLDLLGNSKISNKAYQEIQNNKGLTVKRLIEILEESSLTKEDYEKLILAVQQTAAAKEKAAENAPRLVPAEKKEIQKAETAPAKAEEKNTEQAEEAPQPEAEESKEESIEQTQPVPTPAPVEEQTKEIPAAKPEDGPVKIDADDDEAEEDEEDENDEDEDEEKKPLSRKKLFIIIGVAAAALIALSFVIRFVTTGSLLPSDGEENVVEPAELDESGLFAAMSGLPVSAQPAFTQNQSYTAGAADKESDITDRVVSGDRFIFCDNDTVYILRCSDGEVQQQLDSRSYGEDVKLLGLIDTGNGVAVVSEKENIDDTSAEITAGRCETAVELLDAELPERRDKISLYKFSGQCAGAWTESGKVILALWEGLANSADGSDGSSFMPYFISPDKNTSCCSADKVFISDAPANAGFVTVFSLDAQSGAVSCASAAGSEGQLVSKQGTDLFIFQENTLLRYDISGEVSLKDHCVVDGTAAAFSAIEKSGERIRVTSLENGSGVLTVLDEELHTVMTVNGIGNGELISTCFSGDITYIADSAGKAYGIDAEGGTVADETEAVTAGSVVKLNDSVNIRLSAEGTEQARTGLSLTSLSPDGKTLSVLEINSSSMLDGAQDEYTSSPAEEDPQAMGIDGEKGVIVLPVVYFDGVSRVERFLICYVNDSGEITYKGSISEYDRNSPKLFAAIDGGVITAVTGGRVITADEESCAVTAYVNTDKSQDIYSY